MKNTFKIIVALSVVGAFAFTSPKELLVKPLIVVIDAGHGGKDDGMTFGDFTEKEIINEISSKIKAQNTNEDILIFFTRTGDEFVSLQDRTNFINKVKPDVLLSFHLNGIQNTNASGIEFFISKQNSNYEKSKAIAERLNEKMVKNHSLKSRGIKEAKLFVLDKSDVSAVTVEFGFLSNANDRKFLTDDQQQSRIANTILELMAELK